MHSCAGMDPNIFFPVTETEAKKAIKICDTCPVKVFCGEYSLELPEYFGVWGGMSEQTREKIRRQRSKARRNQAK